MAKSTATTKKPEAPIVVTKGVIDQLLEQHEGVCALVLEGQKLMREVIGLLPKDALHTHHVFGHAIRWEKHGIQSILREAEVGVTATGGDTDDQVLIQWKRANGAEQGSDVYPIPKDKKARKEKLVLLQMELEKISAFMNG